MQTIEDFIKEKTEELFGNEDLDNVAGDIATIAEGIKIGVEFAQRWIPVEEELPESGNNVLVKLSKPDYNSLIKDAKVESIAIAYVNCYNKFITSMMNNWESDFITHWRSIELK